MSGMAVALPVRAVSKAPRARVGASAPRRNVTTCALPAVLPAMGAAVTMYGLMSINEYITHRYYQHNDISKWAFVKTARKADPNFLSFLDGGGHIEHHAETLDDMSLRQDEAWKRTPMFERLNSEKNEWRGTAFEWQITGMMCAQMFPQVYPIYMGLFGWSFLATSAYFMAGMMLHALVWNALHPNMHGLHDVPMGAGAPSSLLKGLRGSWYFDYLFKNHQGHHVSGGRTNYNVACPLVDHLVGTYETPKVWMETMRLKEEMKSSDNIAEPALL